MTTSSSKADRIVHAPRRIEPRFVERVWGAHDLAPWFPSPAQRIGEVWFPAGPLLIKFLFTTEPLSVQVHPGGDSGKTEMWFVLRADPGARIALGFRGSPSPDAVRAAALDGSIEDLLAFVEPRPGSAYFTPAGVVHALGAGLTVLEIQQNSDTTYRLYDYLRQPARPLHLDQGLAVSRFQPHDQDSTPQALPDGGSLLVSCEYFAVEHHRFRGTWTNPADSVLVLLSGTCTLGRLGEVWHVPAGTVVEAADEVELLRTYVPARA